MGNDTQWWNGERFVGQGSHPSWDNTPYTGTARGFSLSGLVDAASVRASSPP